MKIFFKSIFLTLFLIFSGLTNSAAQATEDGAMDVGGTKAKTRVGLAAVKTTSVGEGFSARDFGAGVQNSLQEYLKSPEIEVVVLEAKLPAQISAEAKEKRCDYLIFVTAAHKKGGGGFGKVFGSVAPVLGRTVPYSGNVAGQVAGQIASTAIITAATMASNIKAKDSLQLDLTIQKTETNSGVFAKSYKAKAKSDGEDIFSPLIEQMAQAVIDAAAEKK